VAEHRFGRLDRSRGRFTGLSAHCGLSSPVDEAARGFDAFGEFGPECPELFEPSVLVEAELVTDAVDGTAELGVPDPVLVHVPYHLDEH
jgi:hypothetical protein